TTAFIARETMVSAVINGAISAAFFLGLFGLRDAVPVTGWGGYAVDFVPQSAPVALMACLVPALLARRAVRTGRIASPELPGVAALFRMALICAALSALLGGGVAMIWIGSGIAALAPLPAFVVKIVYGALIGALVTRRVLQRLLRPTPLAKD
ncbi:hypothetical protein, partial [Sphingobium amiense]